MTLRTDYFSGANGIDAQILNAEVAGAAFVASNVATLSSGMVAAAAQCKTTFTVNLVTTYNPSALRLKGLLYNAYVAGIVDGLLTQGIYSFECTPTLNTSDMLATSIDFNFTF
jgi:hypothetical protein